MPKAIKDSLDTNAAVSTGVTVGKGGTKVHATGPKSNTGVVVGKGGTTVNVHGPKSNTGVVVGKGGTTVNVHGPKKHTYVSVKPGPKGFLYKYAATETQIHDDPNAALFFQEKDLTTPTKKTMNLRFTADSSATSFLPRRESESVPFSSDKMPEILDRLNIAPGSAEAAAMESTVKECEEKPIKGEEKRCVASLEGMVDFATSKLGTRVSAVSTNAGDNKEEKYKVVKATRLGHGKEARAVVCHKQSYAYAVFYCHESETTRVYEVSLEGAAKEVKAVAVCHTDTSEWNPKHLAFMVLKVKPGSVPICHFLPEDHVVWVPK